MQGKIVPHIRWVVRRDMTEILEIENHGFAWPWSEQDFINCLRQRNCIGMAAEYDERIWGFMVYELHKAELRVLNLAVHPDARRHGIGSHMIRKLVSKLSPQRRTRILFETSEYNEAGQKFLRDCGFKATAVNRGFYKTSNGDHEDAYLFEYRCKDVDAKEKICAR